MDMGHCVDAKLCLRCIKVLIDDFTLLWNQHKAWATSTR